jgi:CBS domain containing-hemolysin-like protein
VSVFTGTLIADLLLGDVHSLKGKRAVVRPIVVLLNAMGNAGVRLLGVEPRDELASAHTATSTNAARGPLPPRFST